MTSTNSPNRLFRQLATASLQMRCECELRAGVSVRTPPIQSGRIQRLLHRLIISCPSGKNFNSNQNLIVLSLTIQPHIHPWGKAAIPSSSLSLVTRVTTSASNIRETWWSLVLSKIFDANRYSKRMWFWSSRRDHSLCQQIQQHHRPRNRTCKSIKIK